MKLNLSFLMILIVCSANDAMAIGGLVTTVDEPSGAGIVDGATFGMVGKPNHSYLCSIRVNGADYQLSTLITSPGSQTINGIHPATDAAAERYANFINGADSADVDTKDNFVFFVTPGGAAEYGKYTLTIGIDSGAPTGFNANCIDTTVICDFNTYSNDANFLEVTNLGANSHTGRLVLINANGGITAPTGILTFPPELRRDFDIHSLAGRQNYGTVHLLAIDSFPLIDFSASPRISNYRAGQLTSSVKCQGGFLFF